MGILFIGDSLTRHLYLAFLRVLLGNNSTIHPELPWAPSTQSADFKASDRSSCTNDKIALTTSSDPCRHYFARETGMLPAKHRRATCYGEVGLEFVYGGTRETFNGKSSPEYPGLKEAKRGADLILMGYGIWDNFNASRVFPRFKSHLDMIRKDSPKAKVIWLGADARHRDDFVWQTNERVIRYNAEMFARIKELDDSGIST